MSRIYVSSSWQNTRQPVLVDELRHRGHQVYDFRHPFGRDDRNVWESVSDRLGYGLNYLSGQLECAEFRNMLVDIEAKARFIEHFKAMRDADTCILLLPCGRSSHAEAGYMNGLGKRVFVYDTSVDAVPELMYLMFDDYIYDFEALLKAVDQPIPGVCRVCGCTEENPCHHPHFGNCWWVEPSLCSHCAETLTFGGKRYPSIKNDPATEHCINDESNAFKMERRHS